MKTLLIILNWLFGWVLLTSPGDDPIMAFIVVGYFGFASWLLKRNSKEVSMAIKRFEKRIDKILTKQTVKP